jgi:hydroxypyruvate isomerase
MPSHPTRRHIIQSAAATAAALATPALASSSEPERAVKNGRIRQSLVHWCYKKAWPDVDELCRVAKGLGCVSIELIDPQYWATLKKYGLTCAIAGSHGFTKGFNNPSEWDECIAKLRERIDAAADFGCKNVITFTGFAKGIPKDKGMDNCVAGLKKIIGHAEKKKVNLALEMLNSRVHEEMKGHPDYQGDHTDYCIELIKRVGSDRMKLLFDIYHVQIMDGDIIRRIHQYKDYIAHVHTAGNPGRRELDDQQEILYPAIMRALLDINYQGIVGQEYIPTRDPMEGLRQAVSVCDV